MSRSVRVLLLAGSAGAVTGFGESLPLSVARLVRVPVHVTPHHTWVLPLLDAVLLATAVMSLLLAARFLPRLGGREVLTGVTASLGALLLLLVVEAVHDLAALLLAVGIGIQASRMSGSPWMVRVRRGLPWAAAAVFALGAARGFSGPRRQAAAELEALAALPLPRAGNPNVVLLILDTVRSWELGAYGGSEGATPVLDSLAAQGVVFRNAFAPSPWTLPSHASLFTGRWPHEVNAGWNAGLNAVHPTLSQAMNGGGYATGGFVGNLLNVSRYSGLGRGFTHFEDYPLTLRSALFASSLVRALSLHEGVRRLLRRHELLTRKSAPAVNGELFRWLDGPTRWSGRPVFAFLNYFDAHEPFFPADTLAPRRTWNDFVHRGGIMLGENAWVRSKWELGSTDVAIHQSAYRDAVARADAAVGHLLDGLRQRGLLRNTLLVITSDHGEQLGENGLFEHNNSLYPAALSVPLILVWDGRIPPGTVVEDAVSLRDVSATVLDLVGAPAALLPGDPLAPLWTEPSPHPEREILGYLTRGYVDQPDTPIDRGAGEEMWSLVRFPLQYIRNPDGSEELYDLGDDPAAEMDLANDPGSAPALARLRELLDTHLLLPDTALGGG